MSVVWVGSWMENREAPTVLQHIQYRNRYLLTFQQCLQALHNIIHFVCPT